MSGIQHFHAHTGAEAYDDINFSAEPIAELVLHQPSKLALVRHLGLRSRGMVGSESTHHDTASLLVNLTSVGRYRGRVGGTPVDKALQRGQVSFVPPSYDVEIEYPASHSALLLHIPKPLLTTLSSELGAVDLAAMHCEANDRVAQLVLMIEQEIRSPGFASDLMIDGLMRAITTALVARSQQGAPPSPRIHLPPAKLKRVTDYIEANLDRALCLDDLARLAGLSPFHFARVFKLSTGESPYHYLGSRRIARAQVLLAETDMPLAELALACGFASQSHFTAAFTKLIGTPPGRYRRQRRC